jgi:hypothetical protein
MVLAFGMAGFLLTFWVDASLGFNSPMFQVCLYVFFAITMVGSGWVVVESWIKFFSLKKKFRPDE